MNNTSQDTKRLDRYLWLGIVLFTLSLIFSIAVVQTTVVLLTVLWIVKLARDRQPFRRTSLDLPYLAFITARLLSILFSSNHAASVPALYTEIYFYVVFFILTNELPIQDKGKMRLMVLLIISSGVVASLIGSSKFLFGLDQRASSTTSGYYTLGMYLTAALGICLFLGKNVEFFSRRWVPWVVCWLLGCGIALTFNRIHWVIMFSLFLFMGVTRKRSLLFACIVVMLGFVFFSPWGSSRFFNLPNLSAFMSERDTIWKGAAMIIGEHPIFGFGPRTFHEIFPLFAEMHDKAVGSWHNDFLQVYIESGLVGLGTYVWLVATVVFVGIRTYRRASLDPFYKDMLGAVLVAVSTIILGGLAGVFVTDPLASLLFRQLIAVIGLIALIGDGRLRATPLQ